MAVLYGMEKVGCKKLIFSSSATVYGEAEEMPISENSVKKPCLNPYGASKSAIEEMLFGFSAARPDYGIVMLRYFNPVGAHRSGIIGENPSGEPSNLMPLIVDTANYSSAFGSSSAIFSAAEAVPSVSHSPSGASGASSSPLKRMS